MFNFGTFPVYYCKVNMLYVCSNETELIKVRKSLHFNLNTPTVH